MAARTTHAEPVDWQIVDPDDPALEIWIVAVESQTFIPVGPWRGTATEGSILALPEIFILEWDAPPAPKCSLSFHTETDGHVLCWSFSVNARHDARTRAEVTLAGVRNIKIGELKRRATTLALIEARLEPDGSMSFLPTVGGKHVPISRTVDDKQVPIPSEALARIAGQKAHLPQRGTKISDAHLRAVARVYRKALKDIPPTPTKAVTAHFYTSRPNASRWVAQARARGFLADDETPRKTSTQQKEEEKSRGK